MNYKHETHALAYIFKLAADRFICARTSVLHFHKLCRVFIHSLPLGTLSPSCPSSPSSPVGVFGDGLHAPVLRSLTVITPLSHIRVCAVSRLQR